MEGSKGSIYRFLQNDPVESSELKSPESLVKQMVKCNPKKSKRKNGDVPVKVEFITKHIKPGVKLLYIIVLLAMVSWSLYCKL